MDAVTYFIALSATSFFGFLALKYLDKWTLSGGVVYGWLRFSSGSLLFPVLAHSLTNVAFHLTALHGAH